MTNKAHFIISAAIYYIGRKEKPGNAGFADPEFEKELKNVGWIAGQSWCAYFVKLLWLKAYRHDERILKVIKRLNSGGVLNTYSNHKADGTFEISNDPLPGSMIIWQHGDTFKGHTGIVEKIINANTIQTIEGNTNAAGSREGDCVARKLRTLSRPHKKDGLNLLGFINPLEV